MKTLLEIEKHSIGDTISEELKDLICHLTPSYGRENDSWKQGS